MAASGLFIPSTAACICSTKMSAARADWSIAGTGDFNGAGQPDLVLQNTVTGERSLWIMNGTTVAGTVSLGTVSTDWRIQN